MEVQICNWEVIKNIGFSFSFSFSWKTKKNYHIINKQKLYWNSELVREKITFLNGENGSGHGQWMKEKLTFSSMYHAIFSAYILSSILLLPPLSFLLPLLPLYPPLISPQEVKYKKWREPVLLTIIFRRQAPWGSSKFFPMWLYYLFE